MVTPPWAPHGYFCSFCFRAGPGSPGNFLKRKPGYICYLAFHVPMVSRDCLSPFAGHWLSSWFGIYASSRVASAVGVEGCQLSAEVSCQLSSALGGGFRLKSLHLDLSSREGNVLTWAAKITHVGEKNSKLCWNQSQLKKKSWFHLDSSHPEGCF